MEIVAAVDWDGNGDGDGDGDSEGDENFYDCH